MGTLRAPALAGIMRAVVGAQSSYADQGYPNSSLISRVMGSNSLACSRHFPMLQPPSAIPWDTQPLSRGSQGVGRGCLEAHAAGCPLTGVRSDPRKSGHVPVPPWECSRAQLWGMCPGMSSLGACLGI